VATPRSLTVFGTTTQTTAMAEKGGAYGTKAADTDFRKKWDKEEYAEKARQKDLEERERMQENEERMKKGA
jgi:U4/U6.U5 tri-snRNP component SNU23